MLTGARFGSQAEQPWGPGCSPAVGGFHPLLSALLPTALQLSLTKPSGVFGYRLDEPELSDKTCLSGADVLGGASSG